MDTMPRQQQLPRKGVAPHHKKLLWIPADLYTRMRDDAGLKWGEVTQFILEAVKEKLDREATRRAANKEMGKKSQP